jgi:DNA repair protein RAD5
MLSALILTNREAELVDPTVAAKETSKHRQLKLDNAFRPLARQRPQSTKGPSATLIVAPTSLLNQWNEEIKRSSKPGAVKVLVWHGQNRLDLEAAVEADDDDDKLLRVIITSYGVLASEHAKGEKSGSSLSPVFQSKPISSYIQMKFAHLCLFSRVVAGCTR